MSSARRLLCALLAACCLLAAPGTAPYAAAARVFSAASPARSWTPVLGGLLPALRLRAPADPSLQRLERVLGALQFKAALKQEEALDFAFVEHLPASARSPEALAALPAAVRVRVLADAVAAASARLEREAEALAGLFESGRAREAELERLRRLAASRHYLDPLTADLVRALLEEQAEEAVGRRARQLAAALQGTQRPVSPDQAARAELSNLFRGMEPLVAATPRRQLSEEEKEQLVRGRLLPYAGRALEQADERMRPFGGGLRLDQALLLEHVPVFGALPRPSLIKELRARGAWNELVASLTMGAAKSLRARSAAAPSIFAVAADDGNLRLRLPPWAPESARHRTVQDWLREASEGLQPPQTKAGDIQLFTLFGIPVGLNYSFLLILSYLTWILGAGYFGSAAGDISAAARWAAAGVSAAMLYASVLAHEFGHALVAGVYGIRTRAIVLHLLGGMAQLEMEPRKPGAEFWIAIAGPLVSVALGVAFLYAAGAFAAAPLAAAVLKYLGIINIFLAVFNMLPAFPMDGGRVLRAALTKLSGDYYRATRAAAFLGGLFGLLAIVLGTLITFKGGNGILLIILGFFLRFASSAGAATPATDIEPPRRGT